MMMMNHTLYDEYVQMYHDDIYDANGVQICIYLLRLSGTLSLIGSMYIVTHILTKSTRRSMICNQLMVCLSFSDMITSLMFIAADLAVPKGITNNSKGNITTCTIQGMLFWFFGTLSQLYTGNLSICYVLTVKYGWTDRKLSNFSVKCFLFYLPVLCTLLWDVIPNLLWGGFNPLSNGLYCQGGIAFPYRCDDENDEHSSDTECLRGGKLASLQYNNVWWFHIHSIPISILYGLFTMVTSMTLLYLHIRKTEQASDKYNLRSNSVGSNISRNNNHRHHHKQQHSKQAAIQGISYVLAYLLTWTFFVVEGIGGIINPEWNNNDWMQYGMCLTLPLQGFFNALVYLRPRYCVHRRRRRRRTHSNGRGDKNSICWEKIISIFSLCIQNNHIQHEKTTTTTGIRIDNEDDDYDRNDDDDDEFNGDDDDDYFDDPSSLFLSLSTTTFSTTHNTSAAEIETPNL